MTTTGSVRSWFGEEGWGVIDSADTPGECWTHFGDVLVLGYKELTAGQLVNLDWEPAEQGGYRFRAIRVWPTRTDPIETPPVTGSSSAYSSTLTITFDNPDHHHQPPPPD